MNDHIETLNHIKSTLIDMAITFGPRLLVAAAIVGVGYQVARWVGLGTQRSLAKIELEPPIRQLLERLVRALVIGLFLVMALQNMGVELLPLLAGLGIASAGIALAMQGALANLVAGLLLIFTRPFRVGEYISVAGEEGKVEMISLFNTTLAHVDRSRVIIPNRKVVGEILHNFGEMRQLQLEVGVAYDTDLASAIAAIRTVLDSNPRVLKDPAALVKVQALADSAVHIAVKPWVHVKDYGAASGELYKAIHEVCRARNITIPFPQREVRLLSQAAA
jgi:small conductance mechanosensitive channel